MENQKTHYSVNKSGRITKATGKTENHWYAKKPLKHQTNSGKTGGNMEGTKQRGKETTGKPENYWVARKPPGKQIVTFRVQEFKKPVRNQEGMGKFVGHWGKEETPGTTGWNPLENAGTHEIIGTGKPGRP